MQTLPILSNGTTQPIRTILSNGFQAFAAGSWGGATIELQVSANATSGFVTFGTLDEHNPILNVSIIQGAYLQFVVTNATVTTNLQLAYGWLGFVYQE